MGQTRQHTTAWGALGVLVVVGLGVGMGCGEKADADTDPGPGLLDTGTGTVDMTGCRSWLASAQAPLAVTGCNEGGEDWRALFLAAGGALFPVGNDRYYGVWLPEGWQRGDPLIYAVHNTEGCAELIFDFWQNSGARYGMVSLQYRSAGASDFDDEAIIYENLSAAHAELGQHCPIEASPKALYGYSRGGARGYGVSVLDTAGLDFLDVYILDSGVAQSASGHEAGTMADNRYWLWCGERDVDPTNSARTMCETMTQDMAGAVERAGGQIDALIEEEDACHGMFFYDCDKNCGNCRRREPASLGTHLPQLFDYLDAL